MLILDTINIKSSNRIKFITKTLSDMHMSNLKVPSIKTCKYRIYKTILPYYKSYKEQKARKQKKKHSFLFKKENDRRSMDNYEKKYQPS